MPRRIATFRIDAHEQVGERLRVDGHLSRTGIQIYSDGYGGSRREYRDPEDVFHPDSLSSFRGMPATIQHPRGMVTPSTWREVSVGHVGDDVRRADDGVHVQASVWLQDETAIRQVLDGDLQELSVGYTAALDETPGTTPEGERYDARQTEIRGNHVALLRAGQARGGRSVRLRLDANGDVAEENMKIRIDANGLSFEVEAPDDNVLKALEKERQDAEAILKVAETAKVEAEARADAQAKKVKDLEAELAVFRADALKKEREDLVAKAKAYSPSVKIQDSDTLIQIRRAALEARGIVLDGKSDEYITVRFDVESETPATPVEDLRQDKTEDVAEVISIDAAQRKCR